MNLVRNIKLKFILAVGVAICTSCQPAKFTNSSVKSAELFNLMTYNILLEPAKREDYAWKERKDRVIDMIKKYHIDILCAQEDWLHQGQYIIQETGFGKIGVSKVDGTTDGDRAFVSIFYTKKRFEPEKSGHFWLSATPEKPSPSWEAGSNRICNWARFRDKQSGKQFYVFNTHLDHKNNLSRIKSAGLIERKMKEIAGDDPVILTGDMNAKPSSEPINIFRSFLIDSRDISKQPPEGPAGTYNRKDINFKPEQPIDYIFLNKQFSVWEHKTAADAENDLYPTDHFPLITKLQIN